MWNLSSTFDLPPEGALGGAVGSSWCHTQKSLWWWSVFYWSFSLCEHLKLPSEWAERRLQKTFQHWLTWQFKGLLCNIFHITHTTMQTFIAVVIVVVKFLNNKKQLVTRLVWSLDPHYGFSVFSLIVMMLQFLTASKASKLYVNTHGSMLETISVKYLNYTFSNDIFPNVQLL